MIDRQNWLDVRTYLRHIDLARQNDRSILHTRSTW
jgi:hypothetical protein